MTRLAALFVVVTLALGAGVAHAEVAPPVPSTLVVGLTLHDPILQAGVVRGNEVILARGFEVEVARAVARRLGAARVRFVRVASTTRLLAGSTAVGWHLALGGIGTSGGARGLGDLSAPYLTTDIAVVPRRGLAQPKRIADLRRLQLCAVRGSEAAAAATEIDPRRAVLVVGGEERLRAVVRTGACDAALLPATSAGRFVAGWRTTIGPVAVRIARGDGVVAVVAHSGGLDVAAVDRALAQLRRDGTLARLARTLLGLDPNALRTIH